MKLEKGVDYRRSVDIADHFRVWNARHGIWSYFSLARLAYGLLNKSIQNGAHSSVEDAEVSMTLFRVSAHTHVLDWWPSGMNRYFIDCVVCTE